MSTTAPDRLIGLSRDNAPAGLTVAAEQTLQDRCFDLAAALVGGAGPAGIPDPARALLVQAVLLDFLARRMPGPGCEVIAEAMRYLVDPAPSALLKATGTSTERPTGRIAEGNVTVGLPAESVALQAQDRPDLLLHHHRHPGRSMESSR